MKYPSLYRAFNKLVDLPEAIYLDLEDRLTLKALDKHEYLIYAGQTIHHLPFIRKGLMVNYRLDDNSEKHVIQIRGEGLWLGDLYSFFSGKPTNFNIQTFQPTELLLIDHDTFDYITLNYPIFERFFRVSIQNAYVSTLNQIFNLHSQTAKERYLELVRDIPSLLDDIPHYLIASFLNIQPQSLSRIRSKLKN